MIKTCPYSENSSGAITGRIDDEVRDQPIDPQVARRWKELMESWPVRDEIPDNIEGDKDD